MILNKNNMHIQSQQQNPFADLTLISSTKLIHDDQTTNTDAELVPWYRSISILKVIFSNPYYITNLSPYL